MINPCYLGRLWLEVNRETYREISEENLFEIIPYIFDHNFLKIVKNRNHFKTQRESLPPQIQVYLDGVYEGRYPYLDRDIYNLFLSKYFDRIDSDLLYEELTDRQKIFFLSSAISEVSGKLSYDILKKHEGSGAPFHLRRLEGRRDNLTEERYLDFLSSLENTAMIDARRRLLKLRDAEGIAYCSGYFAETKFLNKLWLGYCWGVVLGWMEPIALVRYLNIRWQQKSWKSNPLPYGSNKDNLIIHIGEEQAIKNVEEADKEEEERYRLMQIEFAERLKKEEEERAKKLFPSFFARPR